LFFRVSSLKILKWKEKKMAKINELYNLGMDFLEMEKREKYFSLLKIKKENDPRKIIFRIKNDAGKFPENREKAHLERKLFSVLQKIDDFVEIIELWKVGTCRSFLEKRGKEILDGVESPEKILFFKNKTPIGNNGLTLILDLRFSEILETVNSNEVTNWILAQLKEGVKGLYKYPSFREIFIRQLKFKTKKIS
jgi:hypothetical protein